MRIAIELRNRRLEFKVSFNQIESVHPVETHTHTDGYIYVHNNGENTKKYRMESEPIPGEALTNLIKFRNGLPMDTVPITLGVQVEHTSLPTEPHISPSIVTETQFVRCPCVAYLEGFSTLPACTECTEAGRHSGGCAVLGCEHGWIKSPCYCVRPGYVKCFECDIANEHTIVCANCSPDTGSDTGNTAV